MYVPPIQKILSVCLRILLFFIAASTTARFALSSLLKARSSLCMCSMFFVCSPHCDFHVLLLYDSKGPSTSKTAPSKCACVTSLCDLRCAKIVTNSVVVALQGAFHNVEEQLEIRTVRIELRPFPLTARIVDTDRGA